MKKVLCVLVVAACGGKTKAADPAPKNDTPVEVADDRDEWNEYGLGGYGGVGYGGYGYDDGYDDGYGGDPYGGMGYVPPPPMPPDLTGTWAMACTAAAAKGTFQNITVTFTADAWDVVHRMFSDDKCTKETQNVHMAGGYAFGVQSTAVTTAWEANFTIARREMTAGNKKTAKSLGKMCGIKKMKAGTAVDIHEKGCAKLGMKPAADCATAYDLVAIEGDLLRMGVRPADNDLCTAEKRPTALDTSMEIAFQFATTGVKECDDLVAAYHGMMRCQAIPLENRNMIFESIKPYISQFGAMGADACKQNITYLQDAAKSMGC